MRGAEIGPAWRVQGRRAPHLHHICRTFFAERGWRTIVFTREGRGPLLARLLLGKPRHGGRLVADGAIAGTGSEELAD